MKKIIAIAIIVIVSISGCVLVASQFNPIVGTWKGSAVIGTEITDVFGVDGTCSETTTVLGVAGPTKTGTWTNDSTTIHRLWSDSSTDTDTYAFNSDHSQMVLLSSSGGLSVTFNRQ